MSLQEDKLQIAITIINAQLDTLWKLPWPSNTFGLIDVEENWNRLRSWKTTTSTFLLDYISSVQARIFDGKDIYSHGSEYQFNLQRTSYGDFLHNLKTDLTNRPSLVSPAGSSSSINQEDSRLSPPIERDQPTASRKVFIVHGHDEEMKQVVARTLTSLELDPVILHEQSNQGRAIIEKFEDYSNVPFAVVLLSPDDMGYRSDEPSGNAKPRARQNVILELGFFIGRLGREHVFTLLRGDQDFEIPSDYSGVIYERYDGADGAWRLRLVKELQSLGYDVDANKLP